MLAAEGTILIDPDDDGDMRQYLDSLARMRSIDAERFVPSHGPVIDRPLATVERYIAHRLAREAKIVAALPLERAVEMSELLAIAYGDVSRSLWGLARKSLRAHLVKLQSEGAVRIVGSTVRLVR
jgi:glyoxylase-like metal-dependent hydrolase (beta-lactamase superfamily II)